MLLLDRAEDGQVYQPPGHARSHRRLGLEVAGSLKYEHLYRADIGDSDALAVEVHRFRHFYNTIRPHQALADRTPAQVYTAPRGGPGLVSA